MSVASAASDASDDNPSIEVLRAVIAARDAEVHLLKLTVLKLKLQLAVAQQMLYHLPDATQLARARDQQVDE